MRIALQRQVTAHSVSHKIYRMVALRAAGAHVNNEHATNYVQPNADLTLPPTHS
jgi:hypothetical protein